MSSNGRDSRGMFAPGNKARSNAAGAKRKAEKEALDIAMNSEHETHKTTLVRQAFVTIWDVLMNSTDKNRLTAANSILDRQYGRARQQIEVSGGRDQLLLDMIDLAGKQHALKEAKDGCGTDA